MQKLKIRSFEYQVMPFGLTNAPATFQTYINEALQDYTDVFCIVYLDDVLIYSANEEEHEHHVRRVLERLREWNLRLNVHKCDFHTKEVGFLGYVVGPEGIRMEQERVEAIAYTTFGYSWGLRDFTGHFFDELFHMLDILHADEKRIRAYASSHLISLSRLQFSREEAEMYLQAVVTSAWMGHNDSMVSSTFSSHDNIGDGPYNDMAETYQDFVQKRLALKVPELLLRIVIGIQQQRSHKASTSSINRTRRVRRAAMGMLRMFYLRHLLNSDSEEQLSIQLITWTQIWDEHVDMRFNTYLTLRDILRQSCRTKAQEFAQKLLDPGKELLKSKGSAAEQKRHMGVLWLGIACTSFPDVMYPKSWMGDAAKELSEIAVSRDSTSVGRDARRCLQEFREDRRGNWEALKRVSTRSLFVISHILLLVFTHVVVSIALAKRPVAKPQRYEVEFVLCLIRDEAGPPDHIRRCIGLYRSYEALKDVLLDSLATPAAEASSNDQAAGISSLGIRHAMSLIPSLTSSLHMRSLLLISIKPALFKAVALNLYRAQIRTSLCSGYGQYGALNE
jgi:hypothetical protein